MSNPEIPQENLAEAVPVTPEPAPEPVEAANVDILPSIEDQFKALELKAAEHYDAWLRAKAEGENIRRRAQEDISKAHKFAVEKFAGELLAVKDSLEAALAVQEQTVESFKSGVELTLKQLVSAFEKNALNEVNPVGEKFDPHKHQAIGMVDSEQEANTVVTVLQKGYTIAERTLRPALVMVAKGK
ncbi:nucleotide exchange factor GrpE [Dechloromonas sp.]|uniref:nucleotide exchange factor GrpE n=1 Tax=Dechloromonas sp. TaxID=1917218 RepID=UPI0012168068|nr:nucleotide exchange factor GrpE [Dechloromonas sp.]MBU3695380.1 nucleotide exchange factor GrpE [Dechloromonas sp.]TEX48767.1 MAG: nucleotide exchange factor GrpE [Rhodocyclaceae bacterium]